MRSHNYLYAKKIKYFGCNAFLIESGCKKIAIDPGTLFFYGLRSTTLIPATGWETITHIFITHGDPGHYWHAGRVAHASKAPVICNESMVRNVNGQQLMQGPEIKAFLSPQLFLIFICFSVDKTIEVDGLTVTGIKTTRGERRVCSHIVLNIKPFIF